MLYARIVLGVPVEGPFDYAVPPDLEKSICPGSRVWVSFGFRKMLGYVVGLARRTQIKNPKKILEILDNYPVMDKKMRSLTKELAQYYCCSWGEAIETALPPGLRSKKKLEITASSDIKHEGKQELILLHCLDESARWNIYLEKIKETLAIRRSAIVLFPDHRALLKAKDPMLNSLKQEPILLYRKQAGEAREWLRIKEGKAQIVLALRSGIFAPLPDLGLVIIDGEQDQAYKQDQVPHYHARDVALMRVKLEKASLILGSATPTLESIYLTKRNKLTYMFIPRKTPFPEIKLVNMKHLSYGERKKNLLFSRFLEDAINSALKEKGKVLLFLNRKGFATFAFCHTCGFVQKCPRCNINLVYHFNQSELRCPRCSFKIQPPEICPHCNAGYIKYSGAGTEKIESELSRIFPQANNKRIEDFDHPDLKGVDIVVSTSAIIKQTEFHFDLIAVLGIDNVLNRVDWRASEKTFALLMGLSGLTEKKMIIQTGSPENVCFQALLKKDPQFFYEEELRQRKQLNYPPYQHMVFVKLRSKSEEKARVSSHALFNRLTEKNSHKDIRIVSVNPGQPPQLRGNFYQQILLLAHDPRRVGALLKLCLKDVPHSGIIVTVDVDPL